jgi:hypothetical protein
MWDLMPTKINIFSLDTSIKEKTIDIYNLDPSINIIPIKDIGKDLKKSISDFWNKFYNVTDDYSHNYPTNVFEWIFEEDDVLFFVKEHEEIIGTIIGKVRPFVSLKKSFNIVIVDFLCVHPKIRSKGFATKLIHGLAYWFEKYEGINVHIFHRELTKCPYWALSNSTYWFLDLQTLKLQNSKTQKTFNTKIKNKKRFQILTQTTFSEFGVPEFQIWKILNYQLWFYKTTWKDFNHFLEWIRKPHRKLLHFGNYLAIVEDAFIKTSSGNLAEIIWTSGSELLPIYEDDWFQTLHSLGYSGILVGNHLQNSTPVSAKLIYSGSSWYYMNNWNYIPNSSTLII